MFRQAQERESDRLKIEAALHGIDLDKENKKAKEKQEDEKFLFKDPSEYEKMTKEEREELTRKMMQHHVKFFEKVGLQKKR